MVAATKACPVNVFAISVGKHLVDTFAVDNNIKTKGCLRMLFVLRSARNLRWADQINMAAQLAGAVVSRA